MEPEEKHQKQPCCAETDHMGSSKLPEQLIAASSLKFPRQWKTAQAQGSCRYLVSCNKWRISPLRTHVPRFRRTSLWCARTESFASDRTCSCSVRDVSACACLQEKSPMSSNKALQTIAVSNGIGEDSAFGAVTPPL